jgi:hypothetical protein
VTQSEPVGAWDSGPFDNDDAADFASQLDDAEPEGRIALIRDVLQAAVDADDEDAEEVAFPRAVAAAAVLAASRVDAVPTDSAYAPKFLLADEPFEVPEELLELAVLAVDAVADSDSEYAELFGEAGTVETLRAALTA